MAKDYKLAKINVEVAPGESLKIVRELQGLSQKELAELTGISQPTISALENQRISLGAERAKVFARVLKVHPAVLIFPAWERAA